MNQEKIGKFIAQCRKEQKLTQEELWRKIGVGFKAVFQYTSTPHIYDPNFKFKIDHTVDENLYNYFMDKLDEE